MLKRALTSTEVVDDSEGESSMLLDLPRKTGPTAETSGQIEKSLDSEIQTAVFAAQQDRASHTASGISSFGRGPSVSVPPIAIPPSVTESISTAATDIPSVLKPRPKPRPVYRGPPLSAAQQAAIASSASVSTIIDTSIFSITTVTHADTPTTSLSTDLRPNPQPSSKGAASTIENASSGPSKPSPPTDPIATISSGRRQRDSTIIDDTDYSLDIAERAKLRSRACTTKGKQPRTEPESVIEITSDEDELSFLSKPKAKPKITAKKPPVKRAKTSQAAEIPALGSTPASLPVPTSDFSIHLGSPLPPSDPPLPSTATGPPTSTPPDAVRPGGFGESPLSSPLPNPSRKRKRALQTQDSDNDTSIHPTKKLTPEPALLPAPPQFFASSSSISIPPPAQETAVASSSSTAAVSAAKKRNPRKRRADDEEDDFNPEVEPPKPKGKGRRKKDDDGDAEFGSKPKPKPKKKAEPRSKKPTGQVEVVVEMPKPRSRGRTKSNDAVPEAQSHESAAVGPKEPGPGSVEELAAVASKPASTAARAGGRKRKGKEPAGATSGAQAIDDTGGAVASNSGGAKPSVPSSKARARRQTIESSDEEDEAASKAGRDEDTTQKETNPPGQNRSQSSVSSGLGRTGSFKENNELEAPEPPTSPQSARLPSSSSKPVGYSRAHSIVSKQATPMSELIRKVNSLPGSPFTGARPTHSPYLKSSRSMLKRIAPLHPNRRTPPPPLPRPPPPKKSKKELEREERWEMELEDSIEGWYCLPEEERAAMRKAKRNAELGFDD